MKDAAYYIEKGFSPEAAQYFAKGRRRITAVRPNADFTLTLDFDNGERRKLDCKPFLKPGTVFAPFMDYGNFSRVYLDSEHCVAWDIDPDIDSDTVWNNKVDLCPDSCYMDSVPFRAEGE